MLFGTNFHWLQDPTADASIGNVTGSNSVNAGHLLYVFCKLHVMTICFREKQRQTTKVFLGLGLPWSIGAIYWAALGALTADWLKVLQYTAS